MSIPGALLAKGKRAARRSKRSRSEVFSAALSEHVARHAPDEVTEAMDRVCGEVGEESDPFVAAAAHRVLERSQ